MKIRIGSLVKLESGVGIVLGQPYKGYPIWTVMMGDGRKTTISLGHILEVINESR